MQLSTALSPTRASLRTTQESSRATQALQHLPSGGHSVWSHGSLAYLPDTIETLTEAISLYHFLGCKETAGCRDIPVASARFLN